MATRKATPSAPAPAPELPAARPSRALEAVGVLMVLSALGLCFALWTFDPADRTGERNLVGQLGRQLADAVIGWVGVIGYLGGLFSLAVAGAVLFGRLRWPSLVTLVAGVGLVLGAAISAHLGGGDIYGRPAGGALGAVLGTLLEEAAGPGGTGLAAAGLLVLGLMGLADVSPATLLLGLGRAARSGVQQLKDRIGDRLAARRAARRRAQEVAAAARAVAAERHRAARLADEHDAAERARAAAERAERRRIAILKAEERAESRALARVAGSPSSAPTSRPPGPADSAPPFAPAPAHADGAGLRSPAPLDSPEDLPTELPVRLGPGRSGWAEIADLSPLDDAAAVLAAIDAARSSPPKTSNGFASDVAQRTAPDSGRASASSDRSTPALPEEQKTEEQKTEEPSAAGRSASDRPAGAEEDEAKSAEVCAAARDSEGTDASEPPKPGGPLIHARKVAEVNFDEDVVEAQRKREKKVYRLPPLNLLDHEGEVPEPVDQIALRDNAARLEHKLETYGVRGRVTAIRPGPVVTTYEYQPAPGVKVAKIASLQDDIAMSMEAIRVRIVAPIPGRGVVGIELPNDSRENVYLKEIVAHDRFRRSKSLLTLALGKDVEGDPQVRDLQKMPHLLVAGTTGSGKSVSINTMILSMLYKATPDEVKFIMVDPKMLELSLYNDIPHLLLPVVTDPRQASLALQWAVDEMERRYRLLSDFKVRDLETFNKKLERLRAQRTADGDREAREAEGEPEPIDEEKKGRVVDPWRGSEVPDPLPYIVVLIDEFADLMTVAPRDVETSVQRLAQKARAAGLHVLLATQRPSTDVITGVIKNNFPCRVAFRVASRHDSATIINMPGAEALLGRGDSLMMDTSSPTPARIHGSFVSEEEVERVVEFWKAQGRPVYDESILRPRNDDGEGGGIEPEEMDEHYELAVRIVLETKRASISALQRRLRVGYNRAARMIEMMEMQGIVGQATGPKGEREVFVRGADHDGA